MIRHGLYFHSNIQSLFHPRLPPACISNLLRVLRLLKVRKSVCLRSRTRERRPGGGVVCLRIRTRPWGFSGRGAQSRPTSCRRPEVGVTTVFRCCFKISTSLSTKARTPSTSRGAVTTMIRTLRPLARLPSSVGAGPSRPIALARGFQTGYQKPSSGSVDLAYDVIEPKDPSGLHGDQCLVICHGLFGSKQNWRSLSKRFAQELDMPVYCLVSRPHSYSTPCSLAGGGTIELRRLSWTS